MESDFARLTEMQHRGERRGGDLEQEIDRLQRYLTAARRDLHRDAVRLGPHLIWRRYPAFSYSYTAWRIIPGWD